MERDAFAVGAGAHSYAWRIAPALRHLPSAFLDSGHRLPRTGGLRICEQQRLEGYGSSGQAASQGATIGDAFEVVQRGIGLLQSGLAYEMRTGAGYLHFGIVS